MRYLLSVMLMLTCLTSCGGYHVVESGGWEKKIEVEEVSRAVLTYAVKLKHTRRLFLADSQVYYDDKINRIYLHFTSQDILELEEARELLVDVVEGFLDKINTSPVRYDLKEIPFEAEDLEIEIYFESFYGKYIDGRYTGIIILNQGVSHFYGFDLYNLPINFWHVRDEYYWQSRLFVNATREGEADMKKIQYLKGDKALDTERYK